MLTILRAISQYGGLNPEKPVKGLRNDFKIIYVAPMKALAAENVRKMSKRLGWLGAVVKELTGKPAFPHTMAYGLCLVCHLIDHFS